MTATVLDTSALTAPVQHGVRLFETLDRLLAEPEPVVPRPVVIELEGLANDQGEAGTAAAVGRDLVERCRVAETQATYADDAVIELAAEAAADRSADAAESVAVGDGSGTAGSDPGTAGADSATGRNESTEKVAVTNDAALRDRLLARGVRVIGLSGGNTLGMTEP